MEITEEVFEAVIAPVALAAVIQSFVGLVDEIGPPGPDMLAGIENWPEDWRTGALETLTEDAKEVRDWVDSLVKVLEEASV